MTVSIDDSCTDIYYNCSANKKKSLAEQVEDKLLSSYTAEVEVDGGRVCVYTRPNSSSQYCYCKLTPGDNIVIDKVVEGENSRSKFGKIMDVCTKDLTFAEEERLIGGYVSLSSNNLQMFEE